MSMLFHPDRSPARRVTLACSLCAICLGCASTSPDAAFRATAALARERGAPEVVWSRDAATSAENARAVRELLGRPLDADRAAALALRANPGLQATLERLGIAQADLAQATRLANPGFGASWLHSDRGSKNTLSAGWELLDALLLPQRKKVAAAQLEQTKLEVGAALLDLVAETRRAFVSYQASTELAARLGESEAVEKSAADFAQSLYDAGNLGGLELTNARASWAERHAERSEADLEAERARERVVRLLGLAPEEAPWTAAPLPELPPDEPELDQLEAAALTQRLDLHGAQFAVDVLAGAVALKKGTRFLPLEVAVGVERERETDGLRLTGPSLSVRLPLFDTGKASLARLEAELRQARRQLEARRLEARSEVREARTALRSARERVEFCRDTLLPQRAKALDLTLRSYNMMLAGAPAVLLAKQGQIDAERRALAALRDYWLARIDLEHAAAGPLSTNANLPKETVR